MSVEKTENNLDVYDVFNKWLNYLERDGFSIYTHASRAPQLEMLAEFLIEFNIPFEDAKSIRTKVIQTLMTEDGYKKKNKHKNGNWLKNTEIDFDRIMADYYINDPNKTTSQYAKEYKQDPEIVAWATDKFGGNIPASVLKDCHTIGNSLYFLFIEEFYNRRKTC